MLLCDKVTATVFYRGYNERVREESKGAFDTFAFCGEELVRHPEAEGRAPVMITGNVVVHSQTFGAFADEACCGTGHDIGDMPVEKRERRLEKTFGKRKAVFGHEDLCASP